MFLHALCFKHMFYRHFMYSAFLGRGNGIGLHPGSRQVGLCHHHSLGKGARTAPAPCTGERASTSACTGRMGLKYGFFSPCHAHFFHAMHKACTLLQQGWGSPWRRRAFCKLGGGSARLGCMQVAKRFPKLHFFNAAALLNSLLLPHSA